MKNTLEKLFSYISKISMINLSFIGKNNIYETLPDKKKNVINMVINNKEISPIITLDRKKYIFIPCLVDDNLLGCIEIEWEGDRQINSDLIDNIEYMNEVILKELFSEKCNQIYQSSYTFDDIITTDPVMKKVKEVAKRVSETDTTILITGESGTGKELVAHSIHSLSFRRNNPFIAINCSAIPENLLESELFGYEKGAFTGALPKGKKGKFETADGGTIFLDEVADLPLTLQAKLLRVLQEKKIQKIGSEVAKDVDVRIIAATNKDIDSKVNNNEFRLDLYYRLNVVPICIPPLKERRGDILYLAEYFIEKYNCKFNGSITGVTENVKQVFSNYSWPGNVRELENTIEFALNFCREGPITVDCIPNRLTEHKQDNVISKDANLNIERNEERLIKKALEVYGKTTKGKKLASKALGINITTLYRKLKTYKIDF